jgi:predicted methyltransferase
MYEAGALEGKTVLLLGDDDLTSLAVKVVSERLGGAPAVGGLVVVDVDPAVVSYLARRLRGASFRVECVQHDLRDPLPDRLRGVVDTVFVDPPYTKEGAALFLSRAAEALAGVPGRDVFLAFGSSRPRTALAVQTAIAAMGFTIRALTRSFNEYLGAGILGGTSHLYHLATTAELRPLVTGRYDGPLYTADAAR